MATPASLKLCLPLLCAIPAAAQPSFTDIGAGLEPVSYCAVAWGDLDHDGDLDLALSGETWWGWVTRIYRNDAGTFTGIGSGLVGYKYSALAWSDYDNDGDVDLTVMGLTWNSLFWLGETRIYRNDGGDFHDAGLPIGGVRFGALAWGDCDNDGDLDLALAGSAYGNPDKPYAAIVRHDPEYWIGVTPPLTGAAFASVAWADYDNDGDLDLALAGYNAGMFTRLYRNDGPAWFADSAVALGGAWKGTIAWGDYDNDGHVDLAVAPTGRIHRNNGLGGFSDSGVSLPALRESSLAWGDYDNDGDLDVVITGYSDAGAISMARLYRNDGAGVFTDTNAALPAVQIGSVAWGDYDGDGDLDLAIAGMADTGRISQILRNDGEAVNTSPTPPAPLPAVAAGAEVTFSWSASTDAQTPTPGLSYNLRVGTSPGANNVFAGMADTATGHRQIVAAGNVQRRLSWTLKGLPPGRYFWAVQAIDSACAGSAWSSETWVVTAHARVDFDRDADVDAADFQQFVSCISGPALPAPESVPCSRADFDQDGDVDHTDFGMLQRCFSGADYPADPACGE